MSLGLWKVSRCTPSRRPHTSQGRGWRGVVSTSAYQRTRKKIPRGLRERKRESRPRPGQRKPLPRAQGYSVFHKLHRYEVHTRQTTDEPTRQGREFRNANSETQIQKPPARTSTLTE
eukprot:scaffold106520_cov66-Phaeocystis_antarctica.AAC.3